MRIACHSMEDFIENLIPGKVLDDIVWVDLTRQEINEHRFMITLQASAVIEVGGNGEALVQYGEECGEDLEDGEAVFEGTERAQRRKMKLLSWCETAGVKVKPGILDF